jgi:hypothetical protein
MPIDYFFTKVSNCSIFTSRDGNFYLLEYTEFFLNPWTVYQMIETSKGEVICMKDAA